MCVCAEAMQTQRRSQSYSCFMQTLVESHLTVIWLPACSRGNQPLPKSSRSSILFDLCVCSGGDFVKKDVLLYIETSCWLQIKRQAHKSKLSDRSKLWTGAAEGGNSHTN